jgi:hypothetical protein
MLLLSNWVLLAAVSAAVMTLPAGTVINVRLAEAIDVDVTRAGQTFKARVDDPVSLDGVIAIPREAFAVVQAVKVTQSGAIKGSDAVSLKLNAITFGGRRYEVATEYASVDAGSEGRRSARKIGGGAGLGALVGGIAGGGEGALIGGAVGAITGTAVSASAEQHLRLDAETRLQFRLASSLRIHP